MWEKSIVSKILFSYLASTQFLDTANEEDDQRRSETLFVGRNLFFRFL